jgi:hypothetical protein
LNDHEELTFAGEESVSEEDADAEVMQEEADAVPKVNMNKVSYRNYLIEEFNKAYQDATLLVNELREKNTIPSSEHDEMVLPIACALFSKLAVAEKEYGRK